MKEEWYVMVIKKTWILGVISCVITVSGCQAVGVKDVSAAVTPMKVDLTDIGEHWAKDAILKAVQNGYVDGYDDYSFKPDQNLTRAEFIKMAVNALKLPLSQPSVGDNWYTAFVNAAATAGIHRWSDFVSGDWNTPISRFEMARVAIRAANPDSRKSDAVDAKLLYDATKIGLIQGVDDYGTLASEGATTRGQSVTVIERILTATRGEKIEIKDQKNQRRVVGNAEISWHGSNVFTMLPRYFPENQIANFDLSKFKWDSSDGNLHEEVVEYIAVDMDDPNDPHRKEIEGLPFAFYQRYADGTTSTYQQIQSPSNSFVTYSKVKDVVKGAYPKNLFVLDGGRLRMTYLIPQNMLGKDQNAMETELGLQENTSSIRYTKITEGGAYAEWNTKQFNIPYYSKDFPADGGSYYWIQAQLHPKGDMVPQGLDGKALAISYTPNLRYYNSYGPKLTNNEQVQRFFIEPNIQNP